MGGINLYGAESGFPGLGRRVVKIVNIQRVSFTKMYKAVQNIQRRIDRMVVVVKLNNEAGDGATAGIFPSTGSFRPGTSASGHV